MERTPPAPAVPLGPLLNGLWGSAVGLFAVAAVLAAQLGTAARAEDAPHEQINVYGGLEPYAVIAWQEKYERRLCALSCLVCPLCAWAACRRLGGRRAVACLGSFAVFLPAMTRAIGDVFQGAFPAGMLSLAAAALALPVALRRSEAPAPPPARVEPGRGPGVAATLATVLLSQGLLAALLYPRPYGELMGTFCANLHVLSFVVGPSLFFLDPSLVPAIDFESHYGIGHAYCFSFFHTGSMEATGEAYFWFFLAGVSFFYLSGALVLVDLFRSAWAALACLAVLIVLGLEANSFHCPSNWPVRYPFLFLFVAAAARDRVAGRPAPAVLLAGACAGLSLFWQTDVGVYFGLAGLAFYAATAVFARAPAWRPAAFLAAYLGTFFGLCGVLFGPAVFSRAFVERLGEPLFLYATGFGGVLMRWEVGWATVYNLIAPCVALGTIGWALRGLRGEPRPAVRRSYGYLFLLATCGQLMLFKWVNRSYDVIWMINGSATVVVLFWWGWAAAAALGAAVESALPPRPWWVLGPAPRWAVGAGVLAGVVAGAVAAGKYHDPTCHGGSSSPLRRVHRFYRDMPTELAYRLRKRKEMELSTITVRPEDVEFIRSHSPPGRAVAVVSEKECVYLVQARRAPQFHWAQLFFTHTPMLLDRVTADLERSDAVFVEKGAMDRLRAVNPALHGRFAPIMAREFVVTESSPGLDRLTRRTPMAPAQGGAVPGRLAPAQ